MDDHQLLQHDDHVVARHRRSAVGHNRDRRSSHRSEHHNVVYAGTGDLRFGSFTFGAAGLLRSTDQGATWTILGGDVFNPVYTQPAGNYPQYQAIGKVRVDPNNSNRVVVDTKTGLFLSYDAGANWAGPCLTILLPPSGRTPPV